MTTGPVNAHGRHHACPDCGRRLSVVTPTAGGEPITICRNPDCPGHTRPPTEEEPPTHPGGPTPRRTSDRLLAAQIREEITARRRNGQWR